MSDQGTAARAAAIKSYAAERGLEHYENWGMPEATQLLRQGFMNEVANLLIGDLPGGLRASWLAHFNFKTKGARIADHPFTVVLVRAQASGHSDVRVLCHDRALTEAESSNPAAELQLVEMDDRRMRVESEAFVARYAVSTDHDQDEIRAWQLFDPALVHWLTTQAPDDFSFELQEGALCCFVPGFVDDPAALDALCAAAARVHRRVLELGSDAGQDPPAVGAAATRGELIERQLAAHPFATPPRSVLAASVRFGPIPLLSKTARRLGAEAFFRSHAAGLGLERIEPSAFVASHLDTVLPGAVTQVALGTLPDTNVRGYLLWTTELDNAQLSWSVVMAMLAANDLGYAFTALPEIREAEEEGYETIADADSIKVFKADGMSWRRSAKGLDRFLARACPLLAAAVAAAKR